jgi:hypothetical protein
MIISHLPMGQETAEAGFKTTLSKLIQRQKKSTHRI